MSNNTIGVRTDEELLESLDSATGPGTEWSPEPGETVIGNVVRFEYPPVKGTERVLPIVVLETDDEEPLRIAVKHTVLRDELAKNQVQPEDRLAVRYLGQPDGKKYYSYRVAVSHVGARDEAVAFSAEPRPESEFTEAALGAAR